MYRMDHAYDRHRYWMTAGELIEDARASTSRENIYMTFQDDWVAFKTEGHDESAAADVGQRLPAQRLDLAQRSQELLEKHTVGLSTQEKDWLLHDNVAELYGL